MEKSVWVDKTSYAQGTRKKAEPRIWEIEVNDGLKITVHRHIHYGDAWLLTCRRIGLEHERLESLDVDEAKREALVITSNKLEEIRRKAQDAIEKIDIILA